MVDVCTRIYVGIRVVFEFRIIEIIGLELSHVNKIEKLCKFFAL